MKIVSAILLIGGLTGALRAGDDDRLELYTDVQYTITVPVGCSSWMLGATSSAALLFFTNRGNCVKKEFLSGASGTAPFVYERAMNVRIVETTDCCIRVLADGHSGWVNREVLAVASESRKIYDAHITDERVYAEEQAKKDAAEAARRKRLALERQRARTEEEARAAEERAKARAACHLIYTKTADKKIGDLTVKEAQQVQACQALGLYSAP